MDNIQFEINSSAFKFHYLQDYAKYLLENQLREFVTVGIRFAKEANLPLLKPLSRFSEPELVEISTASNKRLLEAIINNNISEHIKGSVKNWIENRTGTVQRDEVVAEDITLVFFIRRKTFAYFLDAYTKNVVLQKLIIQEVDVYTTQEELVSYNVYLKLQHEKLVLHQELLLEAQELSGTGSFIINFHDHTKSVYTPEYKRIFEIDDLTTFEKFIEWVHPDDRADMQLQVAQAYQSSGRFEMTYRYIKSGKEKKIKSKGFIVSEGGKPILIRGIVEELAK